MLRAVLAALFVLILAAPANAQRIYSWTDEDGITHYADEPPDQDTAATVLASRAEPESPLDVERGGTERRPRWFFSNAWHGPIQVEVTATERENTVFTPDLPATFVLPGDSRRELFTAEPADATKSWRVGYRTRYMPGDPSARHAQGVFYRPPFAGKKTYRIGQGFGGRFSHTDAANHHAVDIQMPRGAAVHAARAGVVMAVEKHFEDGGSDRDRYADKANYVRILHEDGTMGVYAHMDYGTIRVRPGQVLLEGDYIGEAGESGYATGPHLHFVVQINTGMKLESVPFRFRNGDGGVVRPEKGISLTAP